MKKISRNICSGDANKLQFINTMKCAQSDEEVHKIFEIMHKITAEIDYVSKNTETAKLLANMCCGYQKTMSEVAIMFDAMCARNKVPSTSKYILTMVGSIFGEIIELGCGRFNSIENCRKNLPDDMAILDRIADEVERNGTKFDHSPIVPLLKVIERLDSFDT